MRTRAQLARAEMDGLELLAEWWVQSPWRDGCKEGMGMDVETLSLIAMWGFALGWMPILIFALGAVDWLQKRRMPRRAAQWLVWPPTLALWLFLGWGALVNWTGGGDISGCGLPVRC